MSHMIKKCSNLKTSSMIWKIFKIPFWAIDLKSAANAFFDDIK
jgi:hypothetical protein